MVADTALAVKGWNAYRLRPKAEASWIVSRSENVGPLSLSLRHHPRQAIDFAGEFLERQVLSCCLPHRVKGLCPFCLVFVPGVGGREGPVRHRVAGET